jgi:hypothetical protein
MNHITIARRWLSLITVLLVISTVRTVRADEIPAVLQPISGPVASSPAQTANGNVLALNSAMFDLYSDAAHIFQKNILAEHPVILGLFTGAGGRFILYRPGQEPIIGLGKSPSRRLRSRSSINF